MPVNSPIGRSLNDARGIPSTCHINEKTPIYMNDFSTIVMQNYSLTDSSLTGRLCIFSVTRRQAMN